jgi:hypothetical protein
MCASSPDAEIQSIAPHPVSDKFAPAASAATKDCASLISQRSSVEVLHRNAFQVDSFEAADIDCGDPVALWIGAFSVRVNAARRAKAVLDNVLIERVRAEVVFRCEQAQSVMRHKPKKRSFTRTHGAIACGRAIELTFRLECNLAAVTATFVFHVISP